MTTNLALPAPRSQGIPAPVDRQRLEEAMASARSASTRRCYRSQWNLWRRWAESRGHEVLPAQPLAVADYLLDRADSGASIATLKLARSALAAIHKDAGHPDPTDNEGVRRVLAGLSRTISRPQQQAAALTREVQVAIQATAGFPRMLPSGKMETHVKAQARALLDIALVAVMRDALLRRSEASALTWGDLEPAADGSGRLTVRNSKTDQSGEGSVLYLSPATMDALSQIRPTVADPEQRIFGLSPRQINRRIASAAKAAGIQGDFAGHSPRVGMAIDLAASGCELPALMTAGRWESPTMPARYTRAEAAGRGAVARYYSRPGAG
ncbi:MAG: tyrosine-type recombinase/integrase [Chloroflexota bacterium]|nr:tyrosine-type recombinase/integrase [Chloroflexota bacterium]